MLNSLDDEIKEIKKKLLFIDDKLFIDINKIILKNEENI